MQCRACLQAGVGCEPNLSQHPLRRHFALCTGLQIKLNDGFPTSICKKCLFELRIAYRFRKKCAASELELRRNLNKKYESECENDNFDVINIEDDNSTCDLVIIDDAESSNAKSEINENDETSTVDKVVRKIPKILKKSSIKQKSLSENILKNNESNDTENSYLEERFTKKNRKRINVNKHMCTICGKTFQFKCNLENHERVHSGDKPHTCNVCNKSFTQLGHLSVHARIHTGLKPYQCEICQRSFTISESLKKHLRTHTGERPYACSICEKAFVTKYSLSNHHKRHIGEKKFKCDWPNCHLQFINVSEMKSHRVRHDKTHSPPTRNVRHAKFKSMSILSLKGLSSKLFAEGFK